ncbi:MAG: tetratricopeptide repeat protein [Bacteroidota bacterium]|jgi:TolA-binding protein
MKKKLAIIFSFALLFNFCSSVNDKELFDKAQKNLTDKNYYEAVAGFNKLIEEIPNSEFVPRALFECAKIYHAELFPNTTKEESLNKAVQYYQKLYEGYPDFNESAPAMMMAGFILANELNKTEEAKVIYEEFLKKYPDNQLAGSVKLELESIGKSPEEILQKKIESKN